MCSAACGADLIALDIAMKNTISWHIILSHHIETFREQSVTDRPGNWGAIFDRIISNTPSDRLTILPDTPETKDPYKTAVSSIIDIATSYRALSHVSIAVWDEKKRGTGDTTAFFVEQSIIHNIEVIHINSLQ